MMMDPLMASVEIGRSYELAAEGMEVARLLDRFVRMRKAVRKEKGMSKIERETALFLAEVPLFRGLRRGQLENLTRSISRRHYAAGAVLVRQGRGGVGLFVVMSGKAEAVHARADGTKVRVNTFGPTDFFGELAVLSDAPRTASVVALEDTECLVMVRWALVGKLHQKQMATAMLQELSNRFQSALAVL